MEISETTQKQLEQENPNAPLSYNFDLIPFEGFSSDLKQNLLKWGLIDSMRLKIFRFNVGFSDLNSSVFLQDLISSDIFQANFPGIAVKAKKCTKIGYKKMKINMLNLNFLDTLEQEGLIKKNGRIAPTFGDIIHSVEIVSLIRDAWLNEDSEYYCVFDEEMRKELLIQLFNMIMIGGVLNQYDDMIDPYRDALKEIYKELVSVRKDTATGGVFCDSIAYSLTQINVSFFLNFD